MICVTLWLLKIYLLLWMCEQVSTLVRVGGLSLVGVFDPHLCDRVAVNDLLATVFCLLWLCHCREACLSVRCDCMFAIRSISAFWQSVCHTLTTQCAPSSLAAMAILEQYEA